jgi:hypothetical protein
LIHLDREADFGPIQRHKEHAPDGARP